MYIFEKILPHKSEHCGNIFQIETQNFWLCVAHSFGGFLTRKKLAKLLDQYFGPNDTCEEVAVGTVVTADQKSFNPRALSAHQPAWKVQTSVNISNVRSHAKLSSCRVIVNVTTQVIRCV